jgi:hypothetical protein
MPESLQAHIRYGGGPKTKRLFQRRQAFRRLEDTRAEHQLRKTLRSGKPSGGRRLYGKAGAGDTFSVRQAYLSNLTSAYPSAAAVFTALPPNKRRKSL